MKKFTKEKKLALFDKLTFWIVKLWQFDTINLYIHQFYVLPPMLQYRESLIFGNLKDNLALQEQQLVVLFYYSLFYSIEIKISWFCSILSTSRN